MQNTSEVQIYEIHIYKEYFTLLFKTGLISRISDQSQTYGKAEATKNKELHMS